MPRVHANDIDLYYEITGSGAPLVLISGLGYGLWMWGKMIPGLAERFRVIAFDNRGAGQTGKPDGPYDVQMMADDTAGLMDALEVESADVMGHSMGGFIAQQLALNRPDLVGKLILSATNFGGPNHIPVTAEAMAVIMDRSGDPVDVIKRGIAVACAPGFADAHPDVVEELVAYRLSNPVPPAQYQAQTAVGLGLLSAEACFEHRLKDVQAPTLILFGEHDKVVPPANADLLAEKLPNARIKILPDAGHIFPIETPDAAVDAVVEFLFPVSEGGR
ncbi:MAG: alpha/beta hydrolase [Chloroflexi bacterium]|nr:alpha/beta hydrolase [Chloroflexota bacterium]